ncbi:hypothetical protein, partial [uncultured Virgibacillus sp.]|uniref:hypothetical protein n=1 Tax=uncultured Virgibacillus sp. TaxID=417355 RepID=UPI00260BCB5A
PLQLLWEMFDLKIHFFERVLLKKLAKGQTPRKGQWAAGVVVKQAGGWDITSPYEVKKDSSYQKMIAGIFF